MMQREFLDETIDRVAAGLTVVPGEPSFSTRIRDELHHPRRTWIVPALLVVPTVALVIVALANTLMRPAPAPHRIVVTELTARPLAPLSPARVPIPDVPPKVFARVSALPAAHETPEARNQDVTMAPLTLQPLTVSDVDIEPLHVDGLQIADIAASEQKEPR